MKQYSTLLVMTLALAVQVIFCATVQGETYGDVSVTEQAVPQPSVRRHGYVEYRYVLFNDSSDKQHQVRVVVPGNSWANSGQVSRTVTLLPKAQGRMSMWLPTVEANGQGARIYIDGRMQEQLVGSSQISSSYANMSGSFDDVVLFSQGVDSRFRDELSAIKAKSSGGGYSASKEFGQRTTMPVSQWSEAWLGYSGFDGLVMTQNEWRSLSGSVGDAIYSWVEAGGCVLVVGEIELPQRWQNHQVSWTHTSVPDLRVAKIGLGRVGKIGADRLLGWSDSQLKEAGNMLWSRPGSNIVPMDISEANTAFPVTDSLTMPARGMLAIMLLFAILIGPVNMTVCARLDKRLWTLVTIPVAAVIFSAGVFAYAMLADGISAVGRSSTLTFLDQKNHRAVTLGWLGYYAPLQPSGGFHFDQDTELTPLIGGVMRSYRGSDSQTSRLVDWSTDQHLTAGWISSRIPTHFTLRKSQSRRERLEVTQDQKGNVTVVNGLGSDIITLYLADDKGQVYTTDVTIAAGQKVTLTRIAQQPGMAGASAEYWQGDPSKLQLSSPVGALGPNYYVATLRDEVFVRPGLENLKSWKTESTILGRFTINSQEQ